MKTEMRRDYAFEKCVMAADALGVSTAPLSKRLADAWILLLRITLSQELPDEARTRLEEAREHVDRVSGNGGPLEDRLKIASDADILAAAETVWKFISAILWNYPVR